MNDTHALRQPCWMCSGLGVIRGTAMPCPSCAGRGYVMVEADEFAPPQAGADEEFGADHDESDAYADELATDNAARARDMNEAIR